MHSFLVAFLVLAPLAAAPPPPRIPPSSAASAGAHAEWDALLQRHVSSGLVDYDGLKADRARLDRYLSRLAETRGVEELPRADQLAFWINAYNAAMVRLVLEHHPIAGKDPAHPAASVLQVPGLFKTPAGTFAGRELSLDDIEHAILRERFGEPRIHAALVCASASCPELRAAAYEAARLEEQLEEAARRFVNDPRRNVFDSEQGVARISRIFDWFAGDFDGEGAPSALQRTAGRQAGALAFAARYLSSPTREAVLAGRLRVEFLPYDWTLNDRAAPPRFDR